jgi:hypothetical protein
MACKATIVTLRASSLFHGDLFGGIVYLTVISRFLGRGLSSCVATIPVAAFSRNPSGIIDFHINDDYRVASWSRCHWRLFLVVLATCLANTTLSLPKIVLPKVDLKSTKTDRRVFNPIWS